MEILIHSEHIQITGILHGITTITLAHGATEVTTTHGVTDMILGTMAATTEDITEVITIHGITDTTLGIMVDGMAVSMILGTMDIMDMLVSMTHTTITCIHTIADGTVVGTHTSGEFTIDHHSAAATELSWVEAARTYIEAHAMRLLPTELLPL